MISINNKNNDIYCFAKCMIYNKNSFNFFFLIPQTWQLAIFAYKGWIDLL